MCVILLLFLVRQLLSVVIAELPTAEGTWELVNHQTDITDTHNNLLREAVVLVSISQCCSRLCMCVCGGEGGVLSVVFLCGKMRYYCYFSIPVCFPSPLPSNIFPTTPKFAINYI